MIFKLDVNTGDETLASPSGGPHAASGWKDVPAPLSEGPEPTGTGPTPRRGCLCRPCDRCSLPFGSCCGLQHGAPGPGLTVSGLPSPLFAHTPGLMAGWLPRELPRGRRTPSSSPVPAPTSCTNPWARRSTSGPADCLDSEVLTMTPVAFSLTQGVLLYEEKFENDKS